MGMFNHLKKVGLLFAVPLLAFQVGGCALDGNAGGVNSTPAPLASTLKDEKALYLAEAAFAGATTLIEAGAKNGAINGANAGLIGHYYAQAKEALDAARRAHLLGNTSLRDVKAGEVQDLIVQIIGLTKSK